MVRLEEMAMRNNVLLAVSMALLVTAGACAAAPAVPATAERAILEASVPAAGASVAGPVDQLEMRFDPPARLLEVTIADGSGELMPMMVSAVGEVRDYALPLSGLEPGPYTVSWRASVAGQEHRGSFAFAVR